MPEAGRSIQAATSHLLGDKFSRESAFDCQFFNSSNQKQPVQMTSWGLSTRAIGAIVMLHADNKGMVWPPRVAEMQVLVTEDVSPANPICKF